MGNCMSNASVWLIRHGESSMNAGTWADNPHAASLTELGKQQAEKCALAINQAPTSIITSPAARAIETAQPIMHRWPNAARIIWPIQEFVYLSPNKLTPLTSAERKKRVADYWEQGDPYYCDGGDAESFSDFLHRLQHFQANLNELNGFNVVIGHSQFFKGYLLGRVNGFTASKKWMQEFRQREMSQSIENGAIIKLQIPL